MLVASAAINHPTCKVMCHHGTVKLRYACGEICSVTPVTSHKPAKINVISSSRVNLIMH